MLIDVKLQEKNHCKARHCDACPCRSRIKTRW